MVSELVTIEATENELAQDMVVGGIVFVSPAKYLSSIVAAFDRKAQRDLKTMADSDADDAVTRIVDDEEEMDA